MKKLILFFFIISLASCASTKYYYGRAKITVAGKRIHIQPIEQLRQLPDTTIEGILITRKY